MFVWRFTKWLGRVALWVLLPPVGLWRSWRHGRRKRDDRLAGKIAAAVQQPPRDPWAPRKRDALPIELVSEPDVVLRAMVDGELDVTPRSRELAAAELEQRRQLREVHS